MSVDTVELYAQPGELTEQVAVRGIEAAKTFARVFVTHNDRRVQVHSSDTPGEVHRRIIAAPAAPAGPGRRVVGSVLVTIGLQHQHPDDDLRLSLPGHLKSLVRRYTDSEQLVSVDAVLVHSADWPSS